MKWKPLALPMLTVLAILIIGTLVEGHFTDRWMPMDSQKLDRFAGAIALVPKQIGDWKGEDDPISDAEFKATNCQAYLSRQYVNQKTGDAVSVYVVAGTARHVTIHTPDRCYQGSGFDLEGAVETYTMDLGGALLQNPAFATAIFRKPGNAQRVFWTYSDDGVWHGPDSSNFAKFKFGGRPALYKIYLIGPPEEAATSIANEFAKDAFPLINDILFGQMAPAEESDVVEGDLSVS